MVYYNVPTRGHMSNAQQINEVLIQAAQDRLHLLEAESEWHEYKFIRSTDEQEKETNFHYWRTLEFDISEGYALLAAQKYRHQEAYERL